jgi:hypothetical protein
MYTSAPGAAAWSATITGNTWDTPTPTSEMSTSSVAPLPVTSRPTRSETWVSLIWMASTVEVSLRATRSSRVAVNSWA